MWLVGSGEGGARVIIIKWERPKLAGNRLKGEFIIWKVYLFIK